MLKNLVIFIKKGLHFAKKTVYYFYRFNESRTIKPKFNAKDMRNEILENLF